MEANNMNYPNTILANTMVRHNDRLAEASEYDRFSTRTWQEPETTQPQSDSLVVTFLVSLSQKLKAA
jgi:hypothetical protein